MKTASILLLVVAAACFGGQLQNARGQELQPLAYWNFNNAPAGDVLSAEGGGLKGTLNGGAALTADKGGRSGTAGDKGLDLLGGSVKVDDTGALTAINDAFGSDTVTVSLPGSCGHQTPKLQNCNPHEQHHYHQIIRRNPHGHAL